MQLPLGFAFCLSSFCEPQVSCTLSLNLVLFCYVFQKVYSFFAPGLSLHLGNAIGAIRGLISLRYFL